MEWLEEIGFNENPFFLEPIDLSLKGFIDREEERDTIQKYVATKRGRYIVMGSVGLGKTSLLNVAEGYSKERDIVILKTDFLHQQSKEEFYNQLIKEIGDVAEKEPKIKSKIKDMLNKGQIIKKTKREGRRTMPEVSSKFKAVILEFATKITGEKEKVEEVELFTQPRLQQIIDLFNESARIITDQKALLIISDNLDKLDAEGFNQTLTSIIDGLPTSLIFLTTGDYNRLPIESITLMRDIFNTNIDISEIETVDNLKEFVNGRMKAFTRDDTIPIHFPDEVLDVLLEKTGGNLRETYRYCFNAIVKYGREINRDNMIQIIKKQDAGLIRRLDEKDKRILRAMKSKERYTLSRLATNTKINKITLRKRIHNLIQLNLVFKESGGKGRGRKDRYYISGVISEILE